MKAAVVIGANYGDEGKGLITDYLAFSGNSNSTIIRFNGGAQAGHTVQQPDGRRHVFSHFSSGVFAGSQTYLSDFFIANPVLFKQELEKLRAYAFSPKVAIHPKSVVTTPYDMFVNQIFENSMGDKRHGSCGVGIGETVERSLHQRYRLVVDDLFDQINLKKKLLTIRNEWINMRVNQLLYRDLTSEEKDLIFSDDILEYFLSDIQIFINYCDVSDYSILRKSNRLIFEGAQGLLLDQNHKNFPHVTRSNTGLQNVSDIASKMNITQLDIYYVTRCYLTRHGAGLLDDECSNAPSSKFKDETNLPHEFQGNLRFAPLNIDAMKEEITADLNKLSKNISKTVTLAVTCLDQFEEKIPIARNKGDIIELEKDKFLSYLLNKMGFNKYIFSYGPTRETCEIRSVTQSTKDEISI